MATTTAIMVMMMTMMVMTRAGKEAVTAAVAAAVSQLTRRHDGLENIARKAPVDVTASFAAEAVAMKAKRPPPPPPLKKTTRNRYPSSLGRSPMDEPAKRPRRRHRPLGLYRKKNSLRLEHTPTGGANISRCASVDRSLCPCVHSMRCQRSSAATAERD